MNGAYDVIIIGGGIVGCCCAKYIAERGHKVLLLERQMVGGGTTAAGMGHIVTLDDSEAQFQLCRYSRELWTEFAKIYGTEIEWKRFGTIWVAADQEEMEIVKSKYDFYNRRGIAVEILNKQSLAEAEPNLRPGLCGGLLIPDDAVLYPPAAARLFARIAISYGAEIRQYTEVAAIGSDGSVLLNDGTKVYAAAVIIAAGYHSADIFSDIPIIKRKGLLVVTNRYPEMINHQIIELGYLKSAHSSAKESVAFNLHPCANGKIIIGSSRQFDIDNKDVEFGILGKMLNRCFEYMPKLKDVLAMRSWAGFRPATQDKIPFIGPWPGEDKIWAATGHEGFGITTSIATGKIISEMLENLKSSIPTEPYLPSRIMAGEPYSG